MRPVEITRTIAAPLDHVFETISDVRNFRQAVPHITKVEFLTEQHTGAGTRFRETRRMKGREHAVELQVAEYVPNRRVRMVSDAGGTIWDSLFTVTQAPDGTVLYLRMDIRPHTLVARLTTPLFRSMVAKGVEDDMDAVKAYCEEAAAA